MTQVVAIEAPSAPPARAITESDVAAALARLNTREEYVTTYPHLFPSVPSLDWFIRLHREELIAAGALLRLRSRLMIDVARFNEVVVQVSRKAA